MKRLSRIGRKSSNEAARLQAAKPNEAKSRFRRIHTGPFVWTEAAYTRARESGRLVDMRYNAAQHQGQLARPDRRLPFRDFLRLADDEQLRTMARSVPLCTTR